MPMKDITLIFDFDGTIADTLPEVIKIASNLNHELKLYKEEGADVEKFRNMSTQDFFRTLGIPFYKMFYYIILFQQRLKHVMPEIPVFRDLPDVLSELGKKDYRMGIVTSHPRDEVVDFLKRNNIEVFSFIESTINPFGKHFLVKNIINKYSLNKEKTYYIGDETRDIETATKAGIKCISVTWGYHFRDILIRFKPNYIIDSPKELLDIEY